MVIDPTTATPEPNAASEGVARICGSSAIPVLTLATLGVTLAMGTAVALLVTKRPDVARMAGLANLALGLWVLWAAAQAGRTCMPIGFMAASLPFVVGIASLAASIVHSRRERARKNGGPEADSG